MNFLSHFYFDRHTDDPHIVTGGAMPDLVKHVRKDWTFHPEKNQNQYSLNEHQSILQGWKKHLEIDKHFHSSDFFCAHTTTLRSEIAPILETSPVRPSFLAHISLELMLDSLLLTEETIDANQFYQHLSLADNNVLESFLTLNRANQPELFFPFFKDFVDTRYLHSYREASNIIYALNRICMRIWPQPLTENQIRELTSVLLRYKDDLQPTFMQIFEEIEHKLTHTAID